MNKQIIALQINSLICPNFLVDLLEISGGSWSFFLQLCSGLCTDAPLSLRKKKKNGEKRVSSLDFFFWVRGDICTQASHVAALLRCVLIGGEYISLIKSCTTLLALNLKKYTTIVRTRVQQDNFEWV